MAEGSITQALEIGIIQISAGVDLEEVLRLFPEFAAELRAPLEAAQAARWLASSVAVPEAIQQESRERFVLAAGTTGRLCKKDGASSAHLSPVLPAGGLTSSPRSDVSWASWAFWFFWSWEWLWLRRSHPGLCPVSRCIR